MAAACSALTALLYQLLNTTFHTPGDYIASYGLPFVLPLILVPWIVTVLLRSTSRLYERTRQLETEMELRHEAEARLESLATVDDLTGVANRRAFFEHAAAVAAELAADQRAATVAVLDLDHFKQLNDTRGHAAGDAALRACGAAMRRTIAFQGIVGRLGGEEFGILLDTEDTAEAHRILEALRENIVEGAEVTTSIGATDWGWDEGIDSALARADAALYRAKQAGRDRLILTLRTDPEAEFPSDRERVARH